MILILIIIVSFVLRVTNLNWDNGYGFHADEPYLTQATSRIRLLAHMDPAFYVYGGLPVYLYRIGCVIASFLLDDQSWCAPAKIAVIGRAFSAVVSTLTVYLMYYYSRFFLNRRLGLLVAFLLAFSPWAIREAHYATTENLMNFWLVLTLIRAINFFRKPSVMNAALMGAGVGLAIATKPTSLIFLVIPLTAYGLLLRFRHFRRKLYSRYFLFSLAGLIIALAICSPFTLLHFRQAVFVFRATSRDILGGNPIAFWTLQFTGTRPYLYSLMTMFWQSGFLVFIGIAGLFGLILAGIREKKPHYLLLSVFPTVYGLISFSWFVKFARYNVPFLLLMPLYSVWFAERLRKHSPLLGSLLLFVLVITTLIWGLANWTIYLKPATRITASDWIYKNIPAGAHLLHEDRYDQVPLNANGKNKNVYKHDVLDIYQPDTPEKITSVSAQLEWADYLISTTSRQWGVMPFLSDRFPWTARLYTDLLAGRLLFRQISEFTSYPSLFGYTLNDDSVEETYRIFDHPRVRIFKKFR